VAQFVLEDEVHAEYIGEFETLDDVLTELRRIAALPWGELPNVAPCMSWRTCHRVFLVMAHAKSGAEDWRAYPLETSASGAVWSSEFPAGQVS